jgi:hypothetical protein
MWRALQLPHLPLAEQYLLYMGKDKFENEDLIKHGIETDVWCAQERERESRGGRERGRGRERADGVGV